tara:strand:- start:10 stop:159 length:150 start_codon:yes stop_codon:yes gene_type:complete
MVGGSYWFDLFGIKEAINLPINQPPPINRIKMNNMITNITIKNKIVFLT